MNISHTKTCKRDNLSGSLLLCHVFTYKVRSSNLFCSAWPKSSNHHLHQPHIITCYPGYRATGLVGGLDVGFYNVKELDPRAWSLVG